WRRRAALSAGAGILACVLAGACLFWGILRPATGPKASATMAASGSTVFAQSDWTVLEADYCRSSFAEGAILTKQPDHSVLASGALIQPESYTFRAPTKLAGITGFRLEVLPHPSLPSGGPGRAGNFVLTQFQVLVAPADADPRQSTPVPIRRA